MEDIRRTYTIQWVGPFKSDKEVAEFERKGNQDGVCHSSCFNFYYISGNLKIGRPRIHRYFGIHHKLDGIRKRLNLRHSILSSLKEDDCLHI